MKEPVHPGRLFPVVIALLVATAPLAVELCQAQCEQHGAPQVEQTCHRHHAVMTAAGTTMVALPHLCGHDAGVPASSLTAAPVLPAITVTVVLPALQGSLTAAHPAFRVASPSPPLLQTPLRV